MNNKIGQANRYNAFTMAERRSSRFLTLGNSLAFTMAEILISLTIIGVIAAITLPSLVGNINEKAWATQRKALYSRMSQAIAMLPSLNGYGVVLNADGTLNTTETSNKAALAFVTDGLNKVLKINNICDNTNLSKCGIPSKIKPSGNAPKISVPATLYQLNNSLAYSHYYSVTNEFIVNYSLPNTKAVAFETANSESVVLYYQPNCLPYRDENKNFFIVMPYICANFLYDLNGKKGPNKVGKDIGFITALYATDSIAVAPQPFDKSAGAFASKSVAASACRNNDGRLPNIEEAMSLFANGIFLNLGTDFYWTTKPGTRFYAYQGWITQLAHSPTYQARCLKR